MCEDTPDAGCYILFCGFKLDAKAACPHCKAELVPGSKFCGSCGKQVNGDGQKPA